MSVKGTAASLMTTALPGRQVLFAFLIFILVGGGASVAIRITYQELAPFWSATARFGWAYGFTV